LTAGVIDGRVLHLRWVPAVAFCGALLTAAEETPRFHEAPAFGLNSRIQGGLGATGPGF
jgi:hypothetical protein